MGSKPSNMLAMDRPESGGADRDEEREKSGMLDRSKRQLARARALAGAPGRTAKGKPADARTARSRNKGRSK
jgi:hypothetical protein